MIESVILSVLIGAATDAATPAPGSPPPVTPATCTTLHDVVMPVGYVTKKNDEDFSAIGGVLEDFARPIDPTDTPSAFDVQASMNGRSIPTTGAQTAINSLNTSEQSESMASDKVEKITTAINSNIGVEMQFMDKSLTDSPKGTDAQSDTLRDSVQQLMMLQHSLAAKYEDFNKTFLNIQGMANMQDPGQSQFFVGYLRALLLGQEPQPATNGGPTQYLNADQRTRLTDVAQNVENLRKAEVSFAPDEIGTYNQCNNAHIATPKP
jgi:hypothetical protein